MEQINYPMNPVSELVDIERELCLRVCGEFRLKDDIRRETDQLCLTIRWLEEMAPLESIPQDEKLAFNHRFAKCSIESHRQTLADLNIKREHIYQLTAVLHERKAMLMAAGYDLPKEYYNN
jgi:hypothetical protein